MTDESGTVGGGGAGFDPARLDFRTRDGRAIDRFVAFRMTGWIGARQYTWDLRGACSSGMSRDNLINVEPDAPPPAVKDEGETAELNALRCDLQRLAEGEWDALTIKRHHAKALLASLARRAALVPDAEAVPVAKEPLGDIKTTGSRPRGGYANHDPAELISYIDAFGSEASELLCQCRDVLVRLTAPSTTPAPTGSTAYPAHASINMDAHMDCYQYGTVPAPAPVSPAGGEVSEAEVERLMAYAVMCERRDLRRNEPERWREYLPWVRRYAEEFAAAPKVGPAILTAEKVKAWREEPAVRDAVKHGVQRS